MARHLKGWTLRRARNCRFSAALNVASYARRARASYRQATSANTANAIGTANGIMVDRYHISGNGEGRPGARSSPSGLAAGAADEVIDKHRFLLRCVQWLLALRVGLFCGPET